MMVPEEMLHRMRDHPEIKWTEIARMAFAEMLKELDSRHRTIKIRGASMYGRRLKNKVYELSTGPRAPLKELGLE